MIYKAYYFKKKNMKKLILAVAAFIFIIGAVSCVRVVRQGEVGVKRKFGRLKPKELQPGWYSFNPLWTKIMKVPTRTINLQIRLDNLPTKEGLNVSAEMAVLFKLKGEKAVNIVETVGVKYGEELIRSVVRSAVADVTANFYAKDLHTSEREQIEKSIAAKMMSYLGDRGFVVEAILLKSILMPAGLSRAIEDKLEAEQQAQRMQFILDSERKEAERKQIEAQGIRDAQKIISESLNDIVIKYMGIEAFKKLSNSSNTKVIITDGKTPFLYNDK
jgi:regulator of protease activity HflC (stomatin/prohibitin superfamily)